MAKEIVFTVSLFVDVPESLVDAATDWLNEFGAEARTRLEAIGADSDETKVSVHSDGITDTY